MIDYNTLNTRQKLNVLGLRIQREYTDRRHGEHVLIATTEEEAAQASGFMALPTTRVAPGKQLYMRMAEVKELPTGGFHTIKTAEQTADPAFSTDILTALEEEEKRLYGANSIVAKAAASSTKPSATTVEHASTAPIITEMPEMPALDVADSFDDLIKGAEDVLCDMKKAPYSVGTPVAYKGKPTEHQSDSDFIRSLLRRDS